MQFWKASQHAGRAVRRSVVRQPVCVSQQLCHLLPMDTMPVNREFRQARVTGRSRCYRAGTELSAYLIT
jgi:hypothetical protein